MSLKHAILGFLNYGPSSGYDLKKAFDASVQHFWPADQSQIYRTLAQLADEGWAEMELVEQDDRPDRKVYHITAAGRQELRTWLASHFPHEIYRQPWLIQVFFAAQLADDEVLALFQHEAGALRRRLAASGDLGAGDDSGGELFDAALEAAVKRFQDRHGLGSDSVVGAKTLKALAVPVAERIRQIELNLERWRWLPRDLGRRYVLVNIPDFTLQVIEDGSEVLAMRTVVGRSYRRTPVMSDTIKYLVINPYWEVPTTLAVKDKLPEIRKDPEFLARQKFHVYQGWGSDQREIDPAGVDWQRVDGRNFPYRLRQDPGPLNALGRVKFMFPNKFDVYIHDTPSRELFRSPERAASSGCIRVEAALDLAEVLLRPAPDWNREAIAKTIASLETRTVPLPEPIAVHLQYWTAWADAAGTVHFRDDVYERDSRLAAALALPPPEGTGGAEQDQEASR